MSEKAFESADSIDPPASYQPLEPSAPAVVLPGVQLAARRQQLNLTIEHVANQLNLAPRQIQALEADNYGALPGMASVRGFIRAYAKLLKLDAEPLVQAVATEAGAASIEPLGPALSTTPFSDGRSSLASRRFPLIWLVALAALALALVLLAAIGSQAGWFPALSQSLSRNIDGGLAMLHDAESRPAETGPASAAASVDRASDNAASATVSVSELPAAKPQAKAESAPAPVAPAPVKIERPPVKAAAAPAAQPAAPAAPAAPPAAAKAPDAVDPAAAKDLLVLKLRQDSWIDIRRSNNSPVVSRLARAGEVETVKVTGPLALTIGNAPGVELSLRGKVLAIEAEDSSNVAHITLR